MTHGVCITARYIWPSAGPAFPPQGESRKLAENLMKTSKSSFWDRSWKIYGQKLFRSVIPVERQLQKKDLQGELRAAS